MKKFLHSSKDSLTSWISLTYSKDIQENQTNSDLVGGSIAFLIFYNIFCFFTIVLQCRPISFLWEGPSVQASCFSMFTLRALSYTSQGENLLPFTTRLCIWQRQISSRHLYRYRLRAFADSNALACADKTSRQNCHHGYHGPWYLVSLLDVTKRKGLQQLTACSACICSVIKFHYIENYGKTGDFLWDSQNLTIWSVTETNVGILAAVRYPFPS